MASVPEEGNFHYQTKTGSYHYVKKTGYLVKNPSNRIGRWRKRWFMLVDSVEPGQLTGTPERQIRLEYYNVAPLKIKNLRELPKRKGMIDLRSCIAVVANDDKLKGYKNVMNIVMSSFRVHHLAADTKEEMEEWIVALKEFIFSKTKEGQNYFTRSKVKTSVYTDFITSNYYNLSKDDQFVGSQTVLEDIPMHKSNAESDGEGCPPPILMPRTRGSLKRTLSRHAMLTDEEKRKSFKRKQASVHENPENTDGLLHIQLSNWNMTMISRENIKMGDPISTGNTKITSHALWKNTSGEEEKVVVKTALRDPTSIMKEGLTVWQLMHPNIIMLIGAVLIDNPKHIVLEYCEKGTLLEVLQEHGKVLEKGAIKSSDLKPTLLHYCKQVSFGLAYLKSKGIVHGAVKACNVLVTDEDVCKISGFGESLSLKDESCSAPVGGTPVEWTAPEAYSSKNYTPYSDVWSLGIVLYEIWSLGYHPYQSLHKEQILPRLEEKYRLPPPPGVSKDIYRLMIELWHPDPEKRPAIDSVVTFLVQPQEDLLHMNQLPRNSSQHAHSAHTLGAPIRSGEMLYRALQLTYSGFQELAEAGSPQQANPTDQKRVSTESCTYIDVNELPFRHQLRKGTSKNNVTEENKEDDLYWNDLYWMNSSLATQEHNIDDFTPSQSSQESIIDESDIYWNDTLLPPINPNLITENQKTGEEGSNKAENSPASQLTPLDSPLHITHTDTISSLWNITNKPSSEDESEDDYCLPRRDQRRQRKHVSGSKLPIKCHNDASSTNATILGKDHSSSTTCLSETEKETSYYNSSAAEIIGNESQIKDAVHPILSPPKKDPNQFQNSSHLSKSCGVTYVNFKVLEKAKSCSFDEDEVNDNHKYYNSSAAELQALLSPPLQSATNTDQITPQETLDTTQARTSSLRSPDQDQGEPSHNYYYNSSAVMISEDEGNSCEPKEPYYNSAALSEQISLDQEDTHEYPSTLLGRLPRTETLTVSCDATSGYYNSSAVGLLGDGLANDQLEDKTCRSKSMPHYYNLDVLDVEMLIAEENAKKQQSQPEAKVHHHTYYNLDFLPDGTQGSVEDDERSSDLEDSSRVDVLELLRVRAERSKADLSNAHIYRNLDGNFSRDLEEDQSHSPTIVHITPATGKEITSGRSSKHIKRSIKYIPAQKETTKHTVEKLQANTDVIPEYDSILPSKTLKDTNVNYHDRESPDQRAQRGRKRPIPSRKPAQSQSNQGHVPMGGITSPTFNKPSSTISPNHSPRNTPSPGPSPGPSPLVSPGPSPLVSPGPSPFVSPGPSPLVSPSPSPSPSPLLSPSPSPLFSPSKRTPIDPTAYPKRTISPGDNSVKSSQSNLLKLRRGSKDFKPVDLVPKEHNTHIVLDERPALPTDSRRNAVLIEHKHLDKSFSNPILVGKKSEETPRRGQVDIKCQLTKVLSNPQIPPLLPSTGKVRPSPLSKTAATTASTTKPKPPVARKKPVIQESASATSLGSSRGNGNGSKAPATNHSSPAVHNKGLQKRSSELSTAQWHRQTKKPLLPPAMH